MPKPLPKGILLGVAEKRAQIRRRERACCRASCSCFLFALMLLGATAGALVYFGVAADLLALIKNTYNDPVAVANASTLHGTVTGAGKALLVHGTGTSVTLSAAESRAADGSSATEHNFKYNWTLVSTKDGGTCSNCVLANATSIEATASALELGPNDATREYTYGLTVTSPQGRSSYADTVVVVTSRPVAKVAGRVPVAGVAAEQQPIVVHRPAKSVTVSASPSEDKDGLDETMCGYRWKLIEQPAGANAHLKLSSNTAEEGVDVGKAAEQCQAGWPSTPGSYSHIRANTLNVTGLDTPGSYTVQLTVRDTYGIDSAPLDFNITVNSLPIAIASSGAGTSDPPGVVREGSTVTLTDSSIDNDAGDSISSCSWAHSGPGEALAPECTPGGLTTTNSLVAGTHTFTLTAKDKFGGSSSATASATVTVVANALPTPKISGPESVTVQLPAAASTNARVAQHKFRGDESSDSDGDISQLKWELKTLKPHQQAQAPYFHVAVPGAAAALPSKKCPKCTASTSAALPRSFSAKGVVLTSTKANDGVLTTESSSASGLQLLSIAAGIYEFDLSATDNHGFDSDTPSTVKLIVNAPPVIQIKALEPGQIVVGGTPLSATLDAAGTTDGGDADDEVTTYKWEVETIPAGAATPSIANDEKATATAIGFDKAGVYSFKLTVTDKHGGRSERVVTYTVEEAQQPEPNTLGTGAVVNRPVSSTAGKGYTCLCGAQSHVQRNPVSAFEAVEKCTWTVVDGTPGTVPPKIVLSTDATGDPCAACSGKSNVVVSCKSALEVENTTTAGNWTVRLTVEYTTAGSTKLASSTGSAVRLPGKLGSTIVPDAIVRINAAPTAVIEVASNQANVSPSGQPDADLIVQFASKNAPGVLLTLNSTASYDADDLATAPTYAWQGPGAITNSGALFSFTKPYSTDVQSVSLTVTDSDGHTSAQQEVRIASNAQPQIVVNSTQVVWINEPSEDVQLDASGWFNDPESQDMSYAWSQPSASQISHGELDAAVLQVGGLTASSDVTFSVTARDSGGGTSSVVSARIRVNRRPTVSLTSPSIHTRKFEGGLDTVELSNIFQAVSTDSDGTIESQQWAADDGSFMIHSGPGDPDAKAEIERCLNAATNTVSLKPECGKRGGKPLVPGEYKLLFTATDNGQPPFVEPNYATLSAVLQVNAVPVVQFGGNAKQVGSTNVWELNVRSPTIEPGASAEALGAIVALIAEGSEDPDRAAPRYSGTSSGNGIASYAWSQQRTGSFVDSTGATRAPMNVAATADSVLTLSRAVFSGLQQTQGNCSWAANKRAALEYLNSSGIIGARVCPDHCFADKAACGITATSAGLVQLDGKPYAFVLKVSDGDGAEQDATLLVHVRSPAIVQSSAQGSSGETLQLQKVGTGDGLTDSGVALAAGVGVLSVVMMCCMCNYLCSHRQKFVPFFRPCCQRVILCETASQAQNRRAMTKRKLVEVQVSVADFKQQATAKAGELLKADTDLAKPPENDKRAQRERQAALNFTLARHGTESERRESSAVDTAAEEDASVGRRKMAWKAYDLNNDGMIDLAEFEVLMGHATNDGVDSTEIAEAFALLDLDGNGFLEADELGELIEAMEHISRDYRLGAAENPLTVDGADIVQQAGGAGTTVL